MNLITDPVGNNIISDQQLKYLTPLQETKLISPSSLLKAFTCVRGPLPTCFFKQIESEAIKPIQKIKNVFLSTGYVLKSLLFTLHWLPIKFSIDYKIQLLTNKALIALVPLYQSNFIIF